MLWSPGNGLRDSSWVKCLRVSAVELVASRRGDAQNVLRGMLHSPCNCELDCSIRNLHGSAFNVRFVADASSCCVGVPTLAVEHPSWLEGTPVERCLGSQLRQRETGSIRVPNVAGLLCCLPTQSMPWQAHSALQCQGDTNARLPQTYLLHAQLLLHGPQSNPN